MIKDLFPNYTQLDSMDCGPSCLRIISKFYGKNYSLQNLRERCYISRQGVSMLGVSDGAESIGFRTQGVFLNYQQVVNLSLPVILHWNQNHFVVLYKIRQKKFIFNRKNKDYTYYISDPANGKYYLTSTEFKRSWISSTEKGEELGTALISPNDLYHKMVFLLENPLIASRMAYKAREVFLKKYNINTFFQKMIMLYQTI